MQLDINERIAENKLLILYLINKLDFQLTNTQIARLVINIQEMNYFYLQEYISQLVNDKFLEYKIENNNRFYKITSTGKQSLDYFKTMIRASTRQKIDNIIKENTSKLRTETQILADYTPINENEYTVSCKISEGTTCLIDLNLYAGTKEHALSICKTWKANAQEIYSGIVGLLTEKK